MSSAKSMHFEDLSSPFSDRSSPKWQILAGDSQFQDFFVKLQHLVLSISVISGGFDAVVVGGLKGNGPWPCLILEPPSLHILTNASGGVQLCNLDIVIS